MNLDEFKSILSWTRFFILWASFEVWMLPSHVLDLILPNKWFKFRIKVWRVCYDSAFFLTKTFNLVHWLVACERELKNRSIVDNLEKQIVTSTAIFWSEENVTVLKRGRDELKNEEILDFSFFQWLRFWGVESEPIPVASDVGHGFASCVNGDHEYHLVSKGKRDTPIPVDKVMLEYNSRKIRDEFKLF
jgi:hypothetical protein